MKKKFTPRPAVKQVDVTNSIIPLTVRSYNDYAFCIIPGDVIWFYRDNRAIEVETARYFHAEPRGRLRLIGKYVDTGEPVDVFIDLAMNCTIQGKATHLVTLPHGDEVMPARAWSEFSRTRSIGIITLMVFNDRNGVCAQLEAHELNIVRAL